MRKLLFLFAILLVCVSWLAWTYRVRLVSETLTRSLGVPTQVQDVEISTHGLIVRGLALGVPENPKSSPTVFIDSVRASFKPWQLWQEPVHISEFAVDGVYLLVDVSSWQGMAKNWSGLFDRLSKQSVQNDEDKDAKTYVIDHVVVTNVYVAVEKIGASSLRGTTPTIARFELHDVGSHSPRSLPQTVQLILGALLEKTSTVYPQLNSVADRLVRHADEEFQNVLQSIKGQYEESPIPGTWQKMKSWFTW